MKLQRSSKLAFVLACFAALAVYPLVAGNFGIDLVTKTMVFAIFALSLELLVGGTGLVCFGQAAFFGIGAYAAVLLSPQDGPASLMWLLPAAALAAALYALVVGALSLRTKGVYFIMVTLAFAQMAYYVVHDTPLGGGTDGIYLNDKPTLWPGLQVRPVKGEVLRLRWRRGCMPLPQRVVRARVHGRQVYLVPRADGVVVGATQYEHGRDTAPSVTGVRELLDDACAVMPALGEYELAECAAGLRPMTPDNMPIVGRLDERTLVATGHGRSGFLLAPWTAERIAAELLVGAQA